MELENGQLSSVHSASITAASGNHLNHVSMKHGRNYDNSISETKITYRLTKRMLCTSVETENEFNFDLALLIGRNLEPFSKVENEDFREFSKKIRLITVLFSGKKKDTFK